MESFELGIYCRKVPVITLKKEEKRLISFPLFIDLGLKWLDCMTSC